MLVGTDVGAAVTPAPTGPDQDLQPGDRTAESITETVTTAETVAGLLAEQTSSVTKKEQGRLDRLAADAELVAQLRARGCTGPLYSVLEVELVRYGRSVLSSWVRRGQIFASTKAIGRGVPAPEWARTVLHDDAHEREDLVAMVIAEALPAFRRDALEGGGWKAQAGASITTYFMNLLVRTFANHYRKWMAQQERWNPRAIAEATMFDTKRQPVNDPGVIVALRAEVQAELGKLNPRHRRIMSLFIDGHTQAEIAQAEGVTEKAVERVVNRSREALHRLKAQESKERSWSTSTG